MRSAGSGTRRNARVRCAIYTRKSSEEGLEQEFNSLQAQREACEAFINSQRHEGWVCRPAACDDGGFFGGQWIGRLCNGCSPISPRVGARSSSARSLRISDLAPTSRKPSSDGRQPPDLTADKLLEHSRLPLAWLISGPCSALLEPIQTQSSTEIANPKEATSPTASAPNLANRMRQHSGTGI